MKKVEVIRCSNEDCKKFYDSLQFSECPFCGSTTLKSSNEAVPSVPTENKDLNIIDKLKKFPWSSNKNNAVVNPVDDYDEDLKTQGKVVINDGPLNVEKLEQEEDTPDGIRLEDIIVEPSNNWIEPNEIDDSNDDLMDDIEQARSQSMYVDDEKTSGFFKINRENNNTVSKFESNEISEPVVGWLVCIEGSFVGQSFNIYTGKNSIGRSSINKIVLNGDSSVSREKHAFVIFEPSKADFYIQPGDSTGLTYLNDDVVLESKKINNKEKIKIGENLFLLIALCDNEFSWNDYIK